MKKFVCLAAVGAMADAKINSCTIADFEVSFKAFFQGMQEDGTSSATDCYTATSTTIEKWEQASSGWYNLNINDFLAPLYATIEGLNSFVDLFVMCETTNMAK